MKYPFDHVFFRPNIISVILWQECRYYTNLIELQLSTTDASKDLKAILLALLEMVASKKVSGHGRDQALNLLSKNVPRKNKKEQDHTRTLFTIDNGMQ